MVSRWPSDNARTAAAVALAAALTLTLGACGAPAEPVVAIDTEATVAAILTAEAAANQPPAVIPSPTGTTPAAGSVDTALYRDTAAGFEFDYPAAWLVGPSEQHSRGGITAFTSWQRPTDVLPNETPPGETRMDVTVQLWDPTGDLEAFLGQRHLAWDASGIAVVSEERWTLDDGRAAAAFVVEGVDGAQGYFFFTTIADRYLVLSGDGDLASLAEIAHTVRTAPLEY